jgi:hypothetical protein
MLAFSFLRDWRLSTRYLTVVMPQFLRAQATMLFSYAMVANVFDISAPQGL